MKYQLIFALFLFTGTALHAQYAHSYQYTRLEGTIGSAPVIFHLHKLDRETAPDPDPTPITLYFGTYYYRKYMEPIRIEGSIDSTGRLQLYEVKNQGPGGKLLLNEDYSGTWIDGGGRKSLKVRLEEKYPQGSVKFKSGALSETLYWQVDNPSTPYANVSSFYLEPGEYRSPDKLNELKNTFLEVAAPGYTEHDDCCNSMEEVFNQLKLDGFDSFQTHLESAGKIDTTLPPQAYSLVSETQTRVLYNDSHILCMGFYEYYFSGGAHGNYQTKTVSFDLINNRILKLEDIFVGEYERPLMDIMEKMARERAELEPDESLEAYYFTPDIPVTENFYLCPKGIVFSYPPYEIAPYAAGQIEFYVPFEMVRKWLQTGIGN